MTAHYVLCVGGSGAKGGEALIHLLAAGVGTAKTVIHFLDQDVTNGNLIKTRRLADLYQELHKALRPALDRFGNQWLFRAPLNENGEAEVFPPVHPPFERLGQLFERDLLHDEARHFFDSLFDYERETNLELVHGFRGRPGIGQAVLAAGLDTKLPFWTKLNERIDHRLHNSVTSQKFFLMGSVFGGTGAAGVPTVARHLHKRLNRTPDDRRGIVGAALFLPYFSYPEKDPRQEQATGKLLPSATMMARARMALDYYRLEMDQSNKWGEGAPLDTSGPAGRKKPPSFDALYIVGWPEMIDLGYVAAGGGVQDNPALVPELVAALSALHFLQDGFIPDSRGEDRLTGRVFRSGFVGNTIEWEDLPTPRNGVPSVIALRPLVTLIRFAFAYKYVYYEALFGEIAPQCRQQVWFENLIGSPEAIVPKTLETGRQLLRYCDMVLRWAAGMALHGKDPLCRIFDVSNSGFASFTDERNDNGDYLPRRIQLYEEMAHRDKFMKGSEDARYLPYKDFGKDIHDIFQNLVPWTPKLCGLDKVYSGLCTARPKDKKDRNFAAFVHFLWIACAQQEGDRL